MSRRFFNLIHGGTVHAAPNQKFIRSEDFSQAINAAELVEAVKKDAENYRVEIAKECEALKERAQQEGFEAGFAKWAEQLAALEMEIAKVNEEVVKMTIPVALKAAKKIVGREMETHPETIVDIVSNTLKSVSQHKKIAIFVNKKDYEILDANKNRLKQLFENLEALTIRERNDVLPGGCVVETEAGIINAQIENQWAVLERAFASLMKQQEKGTTS